MVSFAIRASFINLHFKETAQMTKITLTGGSIVPIVWLLLVVGGIYGYIHNIILLAHSDLHNVTAMMIIRCIGLIVVPLGAIMGYIS